jgi:predicted XRE-type DNA-binding protein
MLLDVADDVLSAQRLGMRLKRAAELDKERVAERKMAGFVVGGKSVFRDIGFSCEEAEDIEVESSLISQISLSIEQRGMTQSEAAALIGTDQPSLSKILRGRMGDVSVECLTAWLNKLGYGGSP